MFKNPEWIIRQIYRGEGRRFTQDTPILLDVWVKYILKGGRPVELLLTPYQDPTSPEMNAGRLGIEVLERLRLHHAGDAKAEDDFKLAYHQSAVAVEIGFEDLIQVVLPMSHWWAEKILQRQFGPRRGVPTPWTTSLTAAIWRPKELQRIADALVLADREGVQPQGPSRDGAAISPDVLWAVRAIGLTALFCQDKFRKPRGAPGPAEALGTTDADLRLDPTDAKEVVEAAAEIIRGMLPYWADRGAEGMRSQVRIFAINQNRIASESVYVSGLTVKADAVTRLFGVDGRGLRWAVIDGGIDAKHPAFRLREVVDVVDHPARVRPEGDDSSTDDPPRRREKAYKEAFEKDPTTGRWINRTRVVATYDFTAIRQLLRPGLFDSPAALAELPELLRARLEEVENSTLRGELDIFKQSLKRGRVLDWGLLGELIKVSHDDRYVVPSRAHGTHVAGIIGADWRVEDGCPVLGGLHGICPMIDLYDLRVINPQGESDEFSVMAALQFVRSLNSHSEIMAVHGVNLSLSIPHDVRSYACGRTPICDEAERLVGAGIVVVAAAGNYGYRQRMAGAQASLDDSFQSITITDPGNAEAVITVGSTHRDRPHQYGVSYFSSRGPTGDGREKPDLVAPGEKIQSTIPGAGIAAMDGTSQAAPHVSGAAAVLMARHSELIGRPAEIKRILCESATDLGRYRYFQGNGLVDILRALQSV